MKFEVNQISDEIENPSLQTKTSKMSRESNKEN